MKHLSGLLISATILFAGQQVLAGSIDLRDPLVIADMQHVENALQAIQAARLEVEALSGSDTLPGVNKAKLVGRLDELEQFFLVLTHPEKKRLEVKELSGKSIFFNPVKLKELEQ